jgi:hypothetical protein
MFKLLGFVHRLASLALICGVAWLCWQHLGPQKPNIAPGREKAAGKVVDNIVNDLKENRGELRHVALLQFAGDSSGFITERLRSKIEFTGLFDLKPKGFMTKVRGVLNLQEPSYGTLEDALQEGGSLKVAGVIYGTVRRFESVNGEEAWDVDARLCDLGSREVVMEKSYTKADPMQTVALKTATGVPDEEAKGFSWLTRSLAWVLLVLLLPVFSIAFIRSAVRKKSNKINAFVLFVYTASDAALACLLVGAALTSGFGIAVLVSAVILALIYNIHMLSYGVHLEET